MTKLAVRVLMNFFPTMFIILASQFIETFDCSLPVIQNFSYIEFSSIALKYRPHYTKNSNEDNQNSEIY